MKTSQFVIWGGTGFIGRALTKSLSSNHATGWVVGRKPFREPGFDFLDHSDLKAIDTRSDLVGFYLTHIGPSGGAIASVESFETALRLNREAIDRAFLSARKNLKQFIYVSSGGTVYGKATCPIPENTPLDPVSPYGHIKQECERYVTEYCNDLSIPCVILRPSNVYGPDQKLNLIGTAIEHLKKNQEIEIYGPHGVTRDYLYLDSFVNALRAVAEQPISGIYNVGTGHGTNTLAVVSMITRILQVQAQIKNLPARYTDVETNILDSRQFREKFGWKPQETLEEGLLKTIQSTIFTENQP